MVLKVAYNDNSKGLVESLHPTESYNEDLFKERKDAFALKGAWGARKTPFAILYTDDGIPVKGFYSEVGECTVDNIKNYLNEQNYSI